MDQETSATSLGTKDIFDISFKGLALAGTVIGFAFTLFTWHNNSKIKRAEFLEGKIKEFNDASTLLARSILDSFSVFFDSDDRLSDIQILNIGSTRTGYSEDIQLNNLWKTLEADLPIIENSKQRVRRSFDCLLDFFGKLEYYLELDLMKEKEIEYFKYYIVRCTSNPTVMSYANRYEFTLFIKLARRFGLQE